MTDNESDKRGNRGQSDVHDILLRSSPLQSTLNTLNAFESDISILDLALGQQDDFKFDRPHHRRLSSSSETHQQ